MLATTLKARAVPTPQSPYERLELARDFFHQFRGQCFWHSPRELEITEELIPWVAKGLRANGGHLGFMLAAKLRPIGREREAVECR